jgi:hypothetical protein
MLAFVSVLALVGAACGQGGRSNKPQPPSQQPREAAANGLATLQKLVTAQNYQAMGFESMDEVKSAALGQPLAVFSIGLSQLREYHSGVDANSLLGASPDAIYPVMVNGQTRSSVTITKSDSGYMPSSFGNAAIVKGLSQYRQAADSFVVRIPALNMYYLGNRVDNRLMLTSITVDTRLKLEPGKAVPADEVLSQLVPIAAAYNGLPM